MSPDEGTDREALRRAARGGRCATCVHAEAVISARGSAFLRCRHPRLPKYPPMPVLRCAGFEEVPRARGDAGGPADR